MLFFQLPEFAGVPRELQLKSTVSRGDLIRVYSIDIPSGSASEIVVDGGSYGND